jgi:tRNA(Ile)-lysidine synthase
LKKFVLSAQLLPKVTNWTPLQASLHRVLRQRQLCLPEERILLAVSGGQDSLCLAGLFLDLQPKWGWSLAIAHCDHRWRADSAANASHVADLAKTWGLPFFLEVAHTPPESEAQARQWRYATLAQIAQQQGFQRIATGHTASDRAETLLYNLLRGSGADGLPALAWQRPLAGASLSEKPVAQPLHLIRPLLGLSRAETLAYCHAHHLPIWLDSTNEDWHYRRNRIRQQLLPYLREHFNPQVDQALAQTATLLDADVAYLEDQARQLFATVYRAIPAVALNRKRLHAAPLALQRRVIRQFLQQQLATMPQFEHVEKLVDLLPAPNRSRSDPFPGGGLMQVEGDWLIWVEQSQNA